QTLLHFLGQTSQRWLLVYDNADQIEPGQLLPYLPRTGNGHVLITSRNPNYGGVGQVLELGLFTLDEAVRFLFQRRGAEVQRGSAEWAEAERLARELGRLPLALEHAAAYVLARGSSYAAYHRLFTERQDDLWQRAKKPERYHATITTTWELAFDQVKQTPGALELLNLCCFLDPEGIPLALIRQVAGLETSDFLKKSDVLLAQIVSDELALEDALGALRRYSLMQRTADELTLHRLVQAVARSRMDEKLNQNWLETALELVLRSWPFQSRQMETWEVSKTLLPQLISVADLANAQKVETERTATLNSHIDFYIDFFGNKQAALPFSQRALAIREKALGPDHPDTARSLNNLGSLMQAIGDLAAALPYFTRALAIREKVLGPDHPSTAESLNNLAALLQDLGKPTAARPYYERALAISEKALGPDHLTTATYLNNLSYLLRTIGELTAARSYLERALAIVEKTLGIDHPTTARSLNSLGNLQQDMGNLTAARLYYERALTICENTLGHDHPDIAIYLNNLGNLMQDMGNLTTAKQYYEHALAIDEKALGPNHPDTASDLNNLGFLLQSMGNPTAAQTYLERALIMRQKIFGPEHPIIAQSLNNLGGLLQDSGDLAAARSFFKRAFAIREKALGLDHPDTALCLNNLSTLAYYEGDYAEAARLMRQALAIYEKRLGPDHPDTVTSRNSLAAIEKKGSS
ncbi:MAG: tetratricopeptide repeat-containing protein, partial [Anaerolineales bacterium]|nr:tetratricopeptide repeat-containing protein [Anaerolineales bacterium]